MRRQFSYSLLVMVLVSTFSYARQAESKKTPGDNSVVGTWIGSWEGGNTGKFEMTIAKGPDGKLSGSLTASPTDGDGYTVKLKSVDVSGGKLTVKVEDTEGEVEITIEGVPDATAMKGSFSVRSKAQGEQVDAGTWQAKKK